mmetsp:Transcript_3879/g.9350  ORF Transcript_3879/g.9350 Transcript_3879/m.9350 type:complete len:623 (+) Transcript_3879:3-1871(+)
MTGLTITLFFFFFAILVCPIQLVLVQAQCGCGGGGGGQPEWMKAPPPKPAEQEVVVGTGAERGGGRVKEDVDGSFKAQQQHHHHHEHHEQEQEHVHQHHDHNEEKVPVGRNLESPSTDNIVGNLEQDHDGHHGHEHEHGHGHEHEHYEVHGEHDHHSCQHHHSHSHHDHSEDKKDGKPTIFYQFFDRFIDQILETAPWVLMCIIISATLTALIPSTSISSMSSSFLLDSPSTTAATSSSSSYSTSIFIGLVGAALAGLATPLCSCGALPLASTLLGKGLNLSTVVTFLTASQSAGLDSVAITWGLLGREAALARLFGAAILAISTGLAVQGLSTSTAKSIKKTQNTDKCEDEDDGNISAVSVRSPVSVASTFVETCFDTAGEVFPSVLFGLAASTAIVMIMPKLAVTYAVLASDESNSNYDGTPASIQSFSEFVIRVVVLLSALPLQLCEHSTVTFAAAISKAGGSPGLSFAFLLTAPSTNLASLLLLVDQSTSTLSKAMNKTSSFRNWMVLPRVAVAIVGSALVLSYMVDSAGIDLLVEKEALGGGGGGGSAMIDFPRWYLDYAKYLCAALAFGGIGQRLQRSVLRSLKANDGKSSANCSDINCCDSSGNTSSVTASKKDN